MQCSKCMQCSAVQYSTVHECDYSTACISLAELVLQGGGSILQGLYKSILRMYNYDDSSCMEQSLYIYIVYRLCCRRGFIILLKRFYYFVA